MNDFWSVTHFIFFKPKKIYLELVNHLHAFTSPNFLLISVYIKL